MRETYVVENLVGGTVLRKEFRKAEIDNMKALNMIVFKGSRRVPKTNTTVKMYRPKGR